jgi:SAM-dependent methyltransferase
MLNSNNAKPHFLLLVFVHLRVALFNFIEFLRSLPYFFKWSFLKHSLLLCKYYFKKSPYRISKEFLQGRGESQIYTYGETPLTTLDRIATKCRILSKDTVIELGCGRGKTLLWLASFVKCKVIGIELIETFVTKVQKIAPHLEFRHEDLLETDLTRGSVLYFYGSFALLQKLKPRLRELAPGTKVITVSYPLKEEGFTLQKTFNARFPWGKAKIHAYYVTHPA